MMYYYYGLYAYKSTALFMFHQECNVQFERSFQFRLSGFFWFWKFSFFLALPGLAKFVPKIDHPHNGEIIGTYVPVGTARCNFYFIFLFII